MSLRTVIQPMEKLVGKWTYLNYGRKIIAKWAKAYAIQRPGKTIRILDIGCGKGYDLANIKEGIRSMNAAITVELYGIEYVPRSIQESKEKGITVYTLDLERDRIPVEDMFFDIVIANQILEHTKEIFWICSEISRALMSGGIFIAGMPNLAAFHNRLLLLFGEQPTSLEILSAHVRGYTIPGFKRFIQADNYFRVLETRGSNLYPFPPILSKALSRIFRGLSVTIFFLVERTNKHGVFHSILDSRSYETNFFRGKGTSV